jgi:hypothetical protein
MKHIYTFLCLLVAFFPVSTRSFDDGVYYCVPDQRFGVEDSKFSHYTSERFMFKKMEPILYSFTGGKGEQSGDLHVLKEDGPNADILAIGEKFGSLATLLIKDGRYSHTFNYVGTNTVVFVEIGTCSSF